MRKTFTKDFKLISKFIHYLFHLFPGLYMHIILTWFYFCQFLDSFLGGLFSEFSQYPLPYGFFFGWGRLADIQWRKIPNSCIFKIQRQRITVVNMTCMLTDSKSMYVCKGIQPAFQVFFNKTPRASLVNSRKN